MIETTLRQVVGGRVLQSVISDREGLAQEVAEIIEATAEKWGVAIESILLKDINFSVELQQSLSSAATQKRIGESKVIAARAEVDAAKLMRQAADVGLSIEKANLRFSLLLPPCRSDSSKLSRLWLALATQRLSLVRTEKGLADASPHESRRHGIVGYRQYHPANGCVESRRIA